MMPITTVVKTTFQVYIAIDLEQLYAWLICQQSTNYIIIITNVNVSTLCQPTWHCGTLALEVYIMVYSKNCLSNNFGGN